MSEREKRMAILLAAVIGLALGLRLVQSQIVRPLQDKRRSLADLRARHAKLVGETARRDVVAGAWQERTGRTLSDSPTQAALLFNRDVAGLLEASGFSNVRISPHKPNEIRKGFRQGFSEISIGVNAEGTLAQVVQFLRDFYRRPYVSRMRSLVLTASAASAASPARSSGRRAGNAAAGGEEPRLTVSMTLDSLLLPAAKGVPFGALPPEALSDPGAIEQRDPRVLAAELAEYDQIAAVNVFKQYQEPAPPQPPPVVHADPTPPAPPPPRLDPRRDAQHFTLTATSGDSGDLVALVIDDRARTEPPTEHRLNEVLDGGKLVVIHPEGIVVREPPDEGAGQPIPRDWFYPLGARFSERVGLSAVEHPEIVAELALALNPPPH
jgi:hypothetical protein